MIIETLDPLPAPAPDVVDAPPLDTVVCLAEALAREGIPYCHWKSNAHLAESANGTADLDVLVDRAYAQALGLVLGRLGWKRFAVVPWLTHPAVEDYLAFDAGTSRLVHLHLHHELMLGERNLEGYHLPWESHLLASRRLDRATGLYVADPTAELLLLLVRSALKLRTRDRLAAWVGAGPHPKVQREYRWLTARANMADLPALTRRLLGPESANLTSSLDGSDLRTGWLLTFGRSVREELRRCRTYSAAGARLQRRLRQVRAAIAAAERRWIRSTRPRMRIDPRGGVLIALIGCDGSGRSSLAKAITSWLSWKLDAALLYLGSGSPTSLLCRPLQLTLRIAGRGRRLAARGGADPTPATRWSVSYTVWALARAREKRHKLRDAVRARNRGLVVICDRYPQAQVAGLNDGPHLSRWLNHPSRLARAVARWEAEPYEWATRNPPDLVIKLLVSRDTARRRKSGMGRDEVARRVATVQSLVYPPTVPVVEIDASAPPEQVGKQVKRAVWERL
jgi:thymidylate kinase